MKRSYFAGLIVMILLLYPLSYGPVMRIYWDPRSHWTQESIDRMVAFYDPLMRVPVLGDVLVWYSNLCLSDLNYSLRLRLKTP